MPPTVVATLVSPRVKEDDRAECADRMICVLSALGPSASPVDPFLVAALSPLGGFPRPGLRVFARLAFAAEGSPSVVALVATSQAFPVWYVASLPVVSLSFTVLRVVV